MLTHDPEQQKAYDTDPLISRSIDAELLIDLAKAGKRLVEDAEAVDTPNADSCCRKRSCGLQ
jgi:alpha-beta hydrolase superfamily lysophospholipase